MKFFISFMTMRKVKTIMNNTEKNKWSIRGAVILIFLLGFIAGILAINAYHGLTARPSQQLNRRDRLEQTIERLNLSDRQKAEVRGIFDDARAQMQAMRRENSPRVREVRRQTDERLQKVLTSEQWEQFQQIRAETPKRKRGGDNR